MLFNSVEFVLFLPIVFLLYWFVFAKNVAIQNLFLVVCSYIFYGWWDWRFLGLIILSSTVDYCMGLLMRDEDRPGRRKSYLWISILTNLGILGFFKYFNFFSQSLIESMQVLGWTLHASTLAIILPVGISFYTFQTMSYTIDVYRRKIAPTTDLLAFFAYVGFFPQLVAGPIERAANMLPQFTRPRVMEYAMLSSGLKYMLWGFVMKLAIADRLALYVDTIYNNVEMHHGSSHLIATFFFSIQIYGDFAGYSLIAIGCAQLFGIRLMDNFRRPYLSTSFKEFWSRWHISLSTWFRDYVYIPLGGSRTSKVRRDINLMVTFVVSGLWHGANWTFVIWGAAHGGLQILEKRWPRGHTLRWPKAAQIALVFALTCLTWIFFRAASLSEALFMLSSIFMDFGGAPHIGDIGIFTFSILAIGFLFVAEYFEEYRPAITLLHHKRLVVRFGAITFLLLFLLSLGVFDNTQFIYFQF